METNQNKFTPDHRIFTACIYVICTTAICAGIIKCIWSWSTTFAFISGMFSNLSPFLVGFFIAYIMGNMSSSIEKHFLIEQLNMKNRKLSEALSIIAAYVIVIAMIVSAMFFIIPALMSSITDFSSSITVWYDNLLKMLNSINEYLPDDIANSINDFLQKNSQQYLDLIKNGLTGVVTNIVPNIATASMSILGSILDVIVAIIVSIYMLLDKDRLLRNFYRLLYAVFKPSKADRISKTIDKANDIFSGFIIGKTVDSLIIGILCLIILTIFNIGGNYKIIISILIGITNMIPYFGPIFGAIPCILIILLSISPKQALIFAVIILALQQFDGNILGPYILGDRTGLRPIWIIFAITIGGWLGGVVGMFLGVPTIAVIGTLLEEEIRNRLKKHNVDKFPPYDEEMTEKNDNIVAEKIKNTVSNTVNKIVENTHKNDN